jgi:MerR family transcriptional regulator, light-induced transcriptional regulator
VFERLSGEPIYNTRAVVQRTGVPADTFRAWERRYGLPQPFRTATNQRLYSERDIAVINRLRDQTAGGMTISQAVALLVRQEPVLSGAESGTDLPPTPGNGSVTHAFPPLEQAAMQLVDALVRLDGTAAEDLIDEALRHASIESVAVNMLQRAMYEIGSRWEHGSADTAMEHFATALIYRKVGELFNASSPDVGRGPVVAACVAGEQHDLGLLLSALFLSRHGYRMIYLGANMPLNDLRAIVQRARAPVVMLSASREDTAELLRHWTAELRQSQEENDSHRPIVVFGGRIFMDRPNLRATIDGVYFGDDGRDIVHHMDRVFAAGLA